MNPPTHDRLLAGLVSDEAERLYAKLTHVGWAELGTGNGQISLDDVAVRELVDAKVAYRSYVHNDRLLPIARETALQLLLSQHHADIAQRQEAAVAGWKVLDEILSEPRESVSGIIRGTSELAQVVTGLDELNHLSHELYNSANQELLGLTTGRFKRPIESQTVLTPPAPAANRGVRFRMIYDMHMAGNRFGAQLIEMSAEKGEEVRLRAKLPLKMLHVDNKVALIALTETAVDGSLLTRSPLLLAALRDWFEYLWHDDSTTAVTCSGDSPLSAAQRQVLRLLSTGASDEAIARASEMSVRTVRRHVTAILENLGASSRFAAGVIAAKRGWI